MFRYGSTSRKNRDSCAPPLIAVMDLGLKRSPVDIAIVHGFRGKDLQNSLFASRASKKKWPESEHNFMLDDLPHSKAFDFAPFVGGIPWDDTHAFALVAGVFFAAAQELGVRLRWGGDWDMDGLTTDQSFMDWGHLEIEGYHP